MKTCTRCKEEKSLEDFPNNWRRSDGRGSWCRKCKAEQKAEYRATVPGMWRKERYKMTNDEFESMLASQNNACAICERTEQKWCVDHDHSCCPGKNTCGECTRGILCQECNMRLGWFEKNHDVDRLTAYLSK